MIPVVSFVLASISILVTVNCGIDTEIVEIPESNTKVIWVENREIEQAGSTLTAKQSIPQIDLDTIFSNIPDKNRMVHLTHANDKSNRLFLVLQKGVILVFNNDPKTETVKTFLDIREIVNDKWNEEGLLGLTFDPYYTTNGYFYVYYSAASPRRSVISRYSVNQLDQDRADPNSSKIILEVDQPYRNHNGGHLLFGNDGYLYVGFGDGGSAGDPHNNGQDLSTLLGSIIRIDVRSLDNTGTYSVPNDNPFADNNEGIKNEIWAYGLRNPWRFNIDRLTGEIWAGDVGQINREEIDIIKPGLNYGWNIMEGTSCFQESTKNNKTTCANDGLELPVVDYGRSKGCSVIGGYVYRGTTIPPLYGTYIYSDYCSGKVWGLKYDGEQVTEHIEIGKAQGKVYAFGEDERGEIYILSSTGEIYMIIPKPSR